MTPPPSSSVFCNIGSEKTALTDTEIQYQIESFLTLLGKREDVLILPPDYTRFHSQAGKITRLVCEHYKFIPSPQMKGEKEVVKQKKSEPKDKIKVNEDVGDNNMNTNVNNNITNITILPALGTHMPMTEIQIKSMFGEALGSKTPSPFLVHDWRNDVVTIGYAPSKMVSEATDGMVDQPWPAQLNNEVWKRRIHEPTEKQPHKSLVISIGQVVPHEVMGMANFNKNLFVGVGGVESLNLSHFIGAVYGMERMMGRPNNPLKKILNYASKEYLHQLDLWYILTVMGKDEKTGEIVMRGLYIGNDIECYNSACELSLKVNFTMLNTSPKKIVVNLGDSYHSTWLGNKAIYRTRMSVADDGEIIILAPGVSQFGEDAEIDKLIRKHGYIGTPAILKAMETSKDLEDNLSAVAHLIHGSSEGRFKVIYCTGGLTQSEIESVGYEFGHLKEMKKIYNTDILQDGWNYEINEKGIKSEFYYISNPALGLWAVQDRFENEKKKNDTLIQQSNKTVKKYVTPNPIHLSGGVGGWGEPTHE